MWSDESDSKVQRSACVRIFLKTEKKLIQFLVALKRTNKQKKTKNKIGNSCAFLLKYIPLRPWKLLALEREVN